MLQHRTPRAAHKEQAQASPCTSLWTSVPSTMPKMMLVAPVPSKQKVNSLPGDNIEHCGPGVLLCRDPLPVQQFTGALSRFKITSEKYVQFYRLFFKHKSTSAILLHGCVPANLNACIRRLLNKPDSTSAR